MMDSDSPMAGGLLRNVAENDSDEPDFEARKSMFARRQTLRQSMVSCDEIKRSKNIYHEIK